MIPSLQTSTVGFSKSERYLGEIAQRTFLSFWSHPNLYRSRAKELSDLLIVFGEDIIVFSDKSCEFKEGEHGWSRWYRRAILDSAHQLHRAAGWLRKHPTEIYMDAKCERRFPLHVPSTPSIHLVAVATGAREAAKSQIGGDGSLVICTDANGTEQFVIGDLDRTKDFVHIFDDVSLTLVLQELDTVSDFVAYLRKRAAFLRSGPVVVADGEPDLLVHYLKGMNGPEHDFVVPPQDEPPTMIAIDGDWSDFVKSDDYKRKRAADAVSYVWDRMIEDVARHADQGTLETGQEHGLTGTEELLRFFAVENRFSRRQLGRALIGIRQIGATAQENVNVRTVLSRNVDERAYVFCVLRRDATNEGIYRRARQAMLVARAEIAKLRNESLRVIVGVGVAPENDPDQSVDLAVREFPDPWPQEAREAAERLCDQLGVPRDRAHLDERQWHDDEFPAPISEPQRAMSARPRDMKAAAKAKRKAQREARKRNRR